MVPCGRTEKYEMIEVINGDLVTIRTWDSDEIAKSEFIAIIEEIYHREYTNDYYVETPAAYTIMITDKHGKRIRHFGLVKYVTITYIDNI